MITEVFDLKIIMRIGTIQGIKNKGGLK